MIKVNIKEECQINIMKKIKQTTRGRRCGIWGSSCFLNGSHGRSHSDGGIQMEA